MIRKVNIYISAGYGHVIIAPLYRAKSGAFYEQESCISLEYPIDGEILGGNVINSLALFYEDDNGNASIEAEPYLLSGYRGFYVDDPKRSGWTAYKLGKTKTVDAFEDSYIHISVSDTAGTGNTIAVDGFPSKSSELWIRSTIPTHTHHAEIGNRILRVFKACVSGKLE